MMTMMASFSVRRRLRRSALLLILLFGVVAVGRFMIGALPNAESNTAVSATIKRQAGKTEEQRQAFLAALGWVVESEPGEVLEVVIPKEFDETYQSYNQIQTEQGLDLSRYRGKRCKRYTYMVLNHPDQNAHVRLNLLVCSGKIIGGDVCAMGLDGFVQGLAYPAATQTPTTASPAPSEL